MSEPIVTIVTPVYNQPIIYLREALSSVMGQTDPRWRWLIADDCSLPNVWAWIQSQSEDERIQAIRRDRNLGLFANLNSALEGVDTPFVLLLCADDRLRADAIELLVAMAERYAEADLFLSSFDSIDEQGRPIPSFHAFHRSSLRQPTRLLSRRDALEMLLRCGSFNGNLTGMFFRRELFERTKGFREDWTHVSDWEWVHRSAKVGSILLSTACVADVRSHSGQLSARNLHSGTTAREVGAMTRGLLQDPYLRDHPHALRWARHGMQMQAWSALRMALNGEVRQAASIVAEVQRTTGIVATLAAMLAWLPTRIEARIRGVPKMARWQTLDGEDAAAPRPGCASNRSTNEPRG